LNTPLTPIMPDEPFRFACSPGLACFNACCRDLNQSLYPYDILRLKKRLRLSSGEFLERYTSQHIGPGSGLPIVTLKANHDSRLACPFVSEKGCRVYSDRPASCRTYPLVRAISRCRETGKITERFMLLNEPHCLGHNEPNRQTVRQWIEDQQIKAYNYINDKLMQIIRLKNQVLPGSLDLKSRQLVYLALYDLDNFRDQCFNTRLLDNVDVDPQKLTAAETDDTALLEVGMEYVKQVVFKS
jgi:Fe-S-cluster containining protein